MEVNQDPAQPMNPNEQVERTPKQMRLDKLTIAGVNLSTFAFLALQIPQILQNFTKPEGMAKLAWSGYVSGSCGNLLLATYFSSINEWAQVRVQAVGAITNYFVATQVYLHGDFPAVQFWTLAALIAIGLLMPLLYALNVLSEAMFNGWKEATTPIGFGALIFSIAATPHLFGVKELESILLLAIAEFGLIVGLLMLVLGPRCAKLKPLIATMGGWMATFLFMWMPLPQLVQMITEGEDAAKSFNMGFTVLATIGNGLGCTRAFVIKDKIWFVGSFWGLMVGGWLTAVMVWKVRPVQCPVWALVSYTAFLVLYFGAVIKANGDAKKEGLCKLANCVETRV